MPYPLAIVIPTYNRCNALQQCLRHLEQQVRSDFEVVIVDDGSTDSTEAWVNSYRERTPLALRYLRQNNGGPAQARNLAVSVIRSPVTVLIGDDIFPASQFTAVHMQLHEQRPEISVAGVGLTLWDEQQQRVTPFMRWMDTEGMQFNYGELLGGVQPDWKHFYTSNLSVKTELLRQFPFDESFPYAAMEDVEAAYRIHTRHGLEMVFLRDAVAVHLHPIGFLQACRRMERVGASTARFHEIWPDILPRRQNPLAVRLNRIVSRVPFAMPILERIAEQTQRITCPNRLMRFVLAYHHDRGYDGRLLTQAGRQPAKG